MTTIVVLELGVGICAEFQVISDFNASILLDSSDRRENLWHLRNFLVMANLQHSVKQIGLNFFDIWLNRSRIDSKITDLGLKLTYLICKLCVSIFKGFLFNNCIVLNLVKKLVRALHLLPQVEHILIGSSKFGQSAFQFLRQVLILFGEFRYLILGPLVL